MAKISLGEFGYSVPEVVPGPRLQPGVIPDSRGIEKIGDALTNISGDLLERDAKIEATQLILKGKAQFDWFRNGLATDTVGADGRPRYLTAPQDFDKFREKTTSDLLSMAKTPLAQRAIAADLASYGQGTRNEIVTLGTRQKKDFQTGQVLVQIEDAMTTEGISRQEREKRIGQGLGALVSSGLMPADEAIAEQKKYRARLEYGEKFSMVQSATEKEKLYEIRGQLSQFNPLLSPEQNRDLVRLTNERIASLDKETENAVKAKQEGTEKRLTDKYIAGTLTISDVQAEQGNLPAATYERWAKAPDVLQKRDAEAIDDPAIYREVQHQLLTAYRNPAELERIRTRIENLMTGWDQKTKTQGKPVLSRDTAGRLIRDAERYLSDYRTEQRTERNEANTQSERDFRAVEGMLTDQFKSMAKSRVGRAAQAEIAERQARAQEDLIKNRRDPMTWWENFRKSNADLFEQRSSFPSWVVQPGGKPDFGATRDQLTTEYKAKRMTQTEYQRRMDAVREMETKRAP